MGKKEQFAEAVEEAEIEGPPLPDWLLSVSGYGVVQLYSRSDIKPLLKQLARVTGEPLATMVLMATIEQRLGGGTDDEMWEDRTPPELDAWGWPELERNARKKRGSRGRR